MTPVEVSFDVKRDISTNQDVKLCDWGRLLKMRLEQMFPDLSVDIEDDLCVGDTLVFSMQFKNRPTVEEDIRARLHTFMQYFPIMKIQNLRIQQTNASVTAISPSGVAWRWKCRKCREELTIAPSGDLIKI